VKESAAIRSGGSTPIRIAQLHLLTISYTLEGYVGCMFVFWFYLPGGRAAFRPAAQCALGQPPWILSIISIPAGGFWHRTGL
jgi:hypothetical protein